MHDRFIGIVRHADAPVSPHVAKIAAGLHALSGFTVVFESHAAVVASNGTPLLLEDSGLVFGSLYRLGHPGKLTELTPGEQRSIIGSQGRHLIQAYWGGYVAILVDHSTIEIVRAPLGELPCYRVELGGATVFASDVESLTGIGALVATVDWPAVARHLAARDLRFPETCLAGVAELPGGHRLHCDGQTNATKMLWSPWQFAAHPAQIDDTEEACRRVGGSVRACVRARAADFEHIVLMLSGGLDSSILAACLAETKTRVSCVTLVTIDPAGNETDYARTVAEAFAMPLRERLREVARIDVSRSTAARLPRPAARLFTQESLRAAQAIAGGKAQAAIVNGGGGDNVFCALQSASPAADRLLTGGVNHAFWKTAADVAQLAQASLWAVTVAAMRRAWLRGPAFRPPRDLRLLSAKALQYVADMPDHPWLVAPETALPGKAAHIATLAFAQNYVEGLDPQSEWATLAPLLSQPVVEDCLRVPTGLWVADGKNRAMARRAFRSALPAEIIDRRSKGRPDSFSAEIFETYRTEIRDLLLDGLLASNALLDRTAVAALLENRAPVRDDAFHRVLDLVDVEAWARAWL